MNSIAIELSKAAISEIKRMQKVRDLTESNFRIGLATGGCKDFYYTIDLATENEANAIAVTGSDERDLVYEIDGISILIDRQHLAHLDRLKLDYSEDLMGGGFRFQNPQAVSMCECGNSFSVAENTNETRWQLPT